MLFYDNGNTVSPFGVNANAQIIEFSDSGVGVLGVYDNTVAPVPEPGTLLMLALGFLAMFAVTWTGRQRHRV